MPLSLEQGHVSVMAIEPVAGLPEARDFGCEGVALDPFAEQIPRSQQDVGDEKGGPQRPGSLPRAPCSKRPQ